MPSIVALCGGVGGAKLAYGFAQVLPPHDLAVIVNTGDDFEHFGLSICPDVDTVMYTLSGVDNRDTGWGRSAETWAVMDEVGRLGGETWFKLGDKDLALHLMRRQLLDGGERLTIVTRQLAARLGVQNDILPMSDEPVRTIVETAEGDLAFQEYFVRRRCEPKMTGFRFEGAVQAAPSPEVEAALSHPGLRGIVICPSNPYVSIGPMLAIDGIRKRLEGASAPILAVSPIVAGRAIKGPAAKMMTELGGPVSGLHVARLYGNLIDGMVLDEQDHALLEQRRDDDPRLFVAPTVMRTSEDRVALARESLRLLEELQ
ncbi:MAG TPA: 2-phospho-L-lactate transferase [Burkholderiales bacterium]|nr:2-phospho-L-lactate transferase [Burkholderiales bacterium]